MTDLISFTNTHTLSNQTVEVLIVGTLNTKVASTDVVDSFIVHHEAAVRVFQGGVSRQDGVVRLHDGRSDLRCGIHTELKLALLAIIDGETLHQQRSKARSSATTERVEDQETLQTGTVVGNASNLIQNLIDEFLANGVVATSIVIGRVFLASDHLFGMEQAAVGAGADFVDDVGFEIAVDGARNIFALS